MSDYVRRERRLGRPDENGVRPERIPFVGGPVNTLLHDKRLANAESFRPDYLEQGTLDGTVESLIGHDQLYFSLYDALSGERIKCTFAPELAEDVRAAWRQRVLVQGQIRFSGEGHPKDVRVDSVLLREAAESLPQFKGTYIDITGGIESSQYVRGLRDDD